MKEKGNFAYEDKGALVVNVKGRPIPGNPPCIASEIQMELISLYYCELTGVGGNDCSSQMNPLRCWQNVRASFYSGLRCARKTGLVKRHKAFLYGFRHYEWKRMRAVQNKRGAIVMRLEPWLPILMIWIVKASVVIKIQEILLLDCRSGNIK